MHSANVIHRDLKPNNLLVNINCDLKARGGAQRCFVWVCGSYVGWYADALHVVSHEKYKREPRRLCAFCAPAVLPPLPSAHRGPRHDGPRRKAHFLSSVRRHGRSAAQVCDFGLARVSEHDNFMTRYVVTRWCSPTPPRVTRVACACARVLGAGRGAGGGRAYVVGTADGNGRCATVGDGQGQPDVSPQRGESQQ